MELWFSFLAVLVFSMACNLDTVILSMGYAVKGVRVSAGGRLVIAAVTTAVTWLSLALGELAAGVFPAGLTDVLGGLVLVGIGAWFLLDWLRRPRGEEDGAAPAAAPDLWGCVSLAAALAVNNAGVGVAAGVSGISPLWASLCNFAVTLLFLPLGAWLGEGVLGRLLGKYALPLSGVLLAALGAWEAFL